LLHCHQIKSLKLMNFDFGDAMALLSSSIKGGFSRLIDLNLYRCGGDIPMVIKETPIPKLQIVRVCSEDEEEIDYQIVDAIADNYRTVINFDLKSCYISSANLSKIVQCCPGVERMKFSAAGDIERSNIDALAALPRLKCLDIGGSKLSSDCFSSFALLKGLRHLVIGGWDEVLVDILPLIGPKLASLMIWGATDAAWMAVHTSCPNLQYLQIFGKEISEVNKSGLGSMNAGLKKRLKRLASFKVGRSNGKTNAVTLGTDWTGYI
jgi:hypothetical protein